MSEAIQSDSYLCMNDCQGNFDQFEIYMRTISFQLQLLIIKQFQTEHYFNTDRWEQLIKNYIPHLRKFSYEYRKFNPFEYGDNFVYMTMYYVV
jgi:hypothetical protein